MWAYVTVVTREIAFLPRPEVGRWSSDIGGTVGPAIATVGLLVLHA